MNSCKPVNKILLQRLKNVFGTKAVSVEKMGQRGQFGYQSITGQGAYRLTKTGVDVGEEYRINCPFCGDTKRRLYINHLWGTRSTITSSLTLWLAHCFNEECLSDFDNRKDLYEMVYGDLDIPVIVDQVSSDEPDVDKLIKEPGTIVCLSALTNIQPLHPAISWCLARGYDIDELVNLYGVGYCAVSRSSTQKVNERLFVPIYGEAEGEHGLVAWTARLVQDRENEPKWVHSYGTIGKHLYGLDLAKHYETIVVCEGPGDKWAVGPNAVAVLGKTLQRRKIDLLKSVLSKRPVNAKSSVVVLLDPDQDKVAIKKKSEHHIVKATKALSESLTCPVLPVYLPSTSDPGGLDRDFIWACIRRAANKAGIYVSRKKWLR